MPRPPDISDDVENDSPLPSRGNDAAGARRPGSASAIRDAVRRHTRRLFGAGVGRRRRLLHAAGAAAILLGVVQFLLYLYVIGLVPFTPRLSELAKAKAERATTVRSADGEVIAAFKPLNRVWVSLDEISPPVLDALIATEDHRFYRHPGIDVRRIFGAAWYSLTGSAQGGSTLTQQLARNLYPDEIGREVTLTRKFKEMITASRIEAAYAKEEILETYLNTVPFLYNAYGIEMAARTYFGTSASELTLLEGATLVGMLKGTAYYNPVRHPERARRRRNVVLRQMVKHGVLEEARYEALAEEPIRLDFERQPARESRAPHFTDHLRGWLVDWADRNGYNIYRDSLTVHTTLDLGLQEMAQQAVDRWMPALQAVAEVEWSRPEGGLLARSPDAYRSIRRRTEPFAQLWSARPRLEEAFIRATPPFRTAVEEGASEAAVIDSLRSDPTFMEALRQLKTRLEVGLVAVDPQTGHVRAWVGSRDYAEDQYDHVAMARRQPGSTFKPFVYAAALEEGYTPSDTLTDRPVEIRVRDGEVWRPQNAGGYSGRPLSLREALVYSKNTITAQLIDDVGVRDVARLARRMGVRRSDLEEVPSLALGTSTVTLLEMVSAYATLASGGLYRRPVLVTRIENAAGEVVASFEADPERVLSERTAGAVVDMMRGVVDQGTGGRIRRTFGLQADLAGKTGTTQDNADGWFILMHPTLVTGAWVGFNDPRVTFRSDYWGQGGNNAVFVVGEFMRRVLNSRAADLDGAEFPPAPTYEEDDGTLLTRAMRWIGRTAARIGSWFGSAIDWTTDLVFGGDEEQAPPPDAPREQDAPPARREEPVESWEEADSLNRMERESTRLNEILQRLREDETPANPDAPAAVPDEDAPAEAPEGSPDDVSPEEPERLEP